MSTVIDLASFRKNTGNDTKSQEDAPAAPATPVVPPSTVRRYAYHFNEAIRAFILDVVRDVAVHGLVDGEQSLYLTFDTRFPGVALPEQVKLRHPEICTLVLQHQFEDLLVDHEGIEVLLSFSGTPFRVAIPSGSLLGMSDPSVSFGITVIENDLFQKVGS